MLASMEHISLALSGLLPFLPLLHPLLLLVGMHLQLLLTLLELPLIGQEVECSHQGPEESHFHVPLQ
jgi:hypothetical protein